MVHFTTVSTTDHNSIKLQGDWQWIRKYFKDSNYCLRLRSQHVSRDKVKHKIHVSQLTFEPDTFWIQEALQPTCLEGPFLTHLTVWFSTTAANVFICFHQCNLIQKRTESVSQWWSPKPTLRSPTIHPIQIWNHGSMVAGKVFVDTTH